MSKKERKRMCLNCRHRVIKDGSSYCELDESYMHYSEVFEGWCKHWAKEPSLIPEEEKMSYESPIMIDMHERILTTEDMKRLREVGDAIQNATNEMARRVDKAYENAVYMQVNSAVKVDKDELIRALQYDRGQYDKGYADGKRDAMRWIPVSERLPEENEAIEMVIRNAYTDESEAVVGYIESGYVHCHNGYHGYSMPLGWVTHWRPWKNEPPEVEG